MTVSFTDFYDKYIVRRENKTLSVVYIITHNVLFSLRAI